METPKDGETKVCSNGPGHITAMPVYGKKHFKIFYGLGMYHKGCKAYQVCSKAGPRFILIYLTSRSNLLPNAYKLDKNEQS